jgi:hypothetical protein
MVFKDNEHLCDDGDNCHGEGGIIWERSYVANHAYDLVRFTKLCFRYESEFTYRKGDSVWAVTVSCDPTKKDPRFEPKTLEEPSPGFRPDDRERNEAQKSLAGIAENLRILHLADSEDELQEYGTWIITARWSGPLLSDPRWPLRSAEQVQ